MSVRIIEDSLRDTLKGFVDGAAKSVLGSTDTLKQFFELYESICDNNEKLKEICNKPDFKQNKYFKDIYNEAKTLYDGTNKCITNINKFLDKAETGTE